MAQPGYITIRTADLGKAQNLARMYDLIIDNMLGGLRETMEIKARHCGPRGNHEPTWTDEQRSLFQLMVGVTTASPADVTPKLTEETRVANELDYFANGALTDAELAQYARRTSKRPGLCLLALLAAPFVTEALCRLAGAW